jgi:hypothetical protein
VLNAFLVIILPSGSPWFLIKVLFEMARLGSTIVRENSPDAEWWW